MKIKDFMQELYAYTDNTPEHYQKTCDTLKAGNPDLELNGKIASSMFATPEVVKAAKEWGASLLIVHEPTYYDHWDSKETFEAQTGFKREILEKKKKFIEDSGLVIYRYHDHPHHREPDMISEGECRAFGLKGTWKKGPFWAVNQFILDEPMNIMDMAKTMEKHLGIKHVRICGCSDFMVKNICLGFGTPGRAMEQLANNDVVLTGEICEWGDGELVRDSTQLGVPKAIIVMGHICSEREGMRLLVDVIQQHWQGLEVKYFECGDCYTFTD